MYATASASGILTSSDVAGGAGSAALISASRVLAPSGGDVQGPHVYHFKMDGEQYAWPSLAVQYIRNYITTEAAAFAENPST
jgi:hypothetical protein